MLCVTMIEGRAEILILSLRQEFLQEASKYSRHAKRSLLTSEDINNALRFYNCEVSQSDAESELICSCLSLLVF